MRLAALCAVAAGSAVCFAQSIEPLVLVANEGNFEGSLTSFRLDSDGSLTFIDREITGSRTSFDQPCPGCNTFRVSLSPNGAFAATVHASGDAVESVIIYSIAADGTLDVVEELTNDQQGLDIQWVSDDLLAVARTDFGPGNLLRLYNWDGQSLTLADAPAAGDFFTDMELHPNGRWMYCNDSLSNIVRVFDISDAGGTGATLVQTLNIPVFGTQLAVNPSGTFLYAAGGISAGGNAISGFAINQNDGTLSIIPPGTFTSPGDSPKNFAFVSDTLLYAGHGGDSSIQAFSVDPQTGVATATGASVVIGTRGDLREMDSAGGLLFAIDESMGVNVFAIDNTQTVGTLVQIGLPTPTQGITPEDLEIWLGTDQPCNAADLGVPFGFLDLEDVDVFIAAFLAGDAAADIAFPFGFIDLSDVDAFIGSFLAGCP
ncbi:MAG: beta-propeller fold lactonase family protein [Planctomycetota bacterium]